MYSYIVEGNDLHIDFRLTMASPVDAATVTTSSRSDPIPLVDEILDCQFSRWYKTFRSLPRDLYRRRSVTVKSIILPLPPLFRDYVMSDGVRLPAGDALVSSHVPPKNDDDSWAEEDDIDERHEFSFPGLTEQIQSAIDSLGGTVMPKLNWSCPKDATWINCGSLKCSTPGDVYILLKSSDFVMHDFLYAFDNSVGEKPTSISYELVLRQWCNFNPSMEFRCFVWNGDVVAISQRNHTQHFPHLMTEMNRYRSQVLDFYEDYVYENFPGSGNFVFDVYIDKQDRVWLLDFNVWGKQTDPLLFSWDELSSIASLESEEQDDSSLENRRPVIRVVETANQIHQDPLASYRAPIDAVDLASMSGFDATAFHEFMAKCKKPSEEIDDAPDLGDS